MSRRTARVQKKQHPWDPKWYLVLETQASKRQLALNTKLGERYHGVPALWISLGESFAPDGVPENHIGFAAFKGDDWGWWFCHQQDGGRTMYANLRTLCSNLKVNRLYLHECHTVLEYSVIRDNEALRPYVHKQPVARAPEPAPRVQLEQHASPPGDEQPMDTEVAAEPTPSGSSNDAAQAPAPEQTPSAPVDSGAQVPVSSVPAPTISVAAECDIQVPMTGARPDRAQAFFAATQLQRELSLMTQQLAQPATRPEVIASAVREELRPVIDRLDQPVLNRDVVAEIVRDAIARDRELYNAVERLEMSTVTAALKKSSFDRDGFIAAVRAEIETTIAPLVNLPGLVKGVSDVTDDLLSRYTDHMVDRVLGAVNTTMKEMQDQILDTFGVINTSAEKRHTDSMGHIDSMIAERVEPLMHKMFRRLTTKAESGDLLNDLRTSTDAIQTAINELINSNYTHANGAQEREENSQRREREHNAYLIAHTRESAENITKFHASNVQLHTDQQLVLTKLAAIEAELRAPKAPTTPNDDVVKLQAANAKLQAEITKLEKHLATSSVTINTIHETMGKKCTEVTELKQTVCQLRQQIEQEQINNQRFRAGQLDWDSREPNLQVPMRYYNAIDEVRSNTREFARLQDDLQTQLGTVQGQMTDMIIGSAEPSTQTLEAGVVDQRSVEHLMQTDELQDDTDEPLDLEYDPPICERVPHDQVLYSVVGCIDNL